MPLVEANKKGNIKCPVSDEVKHHLSCCDFKAGLIVSKGLVLVDCQNPEAGDDLPAEVDEPLRDDEIAFIEETEIDPDFEPASDDQLVKKSKDRSHGYITWSKGSVNEIGRR